MHGGWGRENGLFNYAGELSGKGGAVQLLEWSGGKNDAVRLQGAEMLRAVIAAHYFEPDSKLIILAHSHGGNVVLAASHLGLAHPIDTLITLNKPARMGRMYKPGDNIRSFYNISAIRDWLQWVGSDGKLRGRTAHDNHAMNHIADTSASPLKPHAALIWDDEIRPLWWEWFLQHHSKHQNSSLRSTAGSTSFSPANHT